VRSERGGQVGGSARGGERRHEGGDVGGVVLLLTLELGGFVAVEGVGAGKVGV
jgi:hypothetical protein